MADSDIRLESYVDWKGRPASSSKHGGMKAAKFIFVVEVLENMTFISIATNLITYFHSSMHYSIADSANMLTNYMGTSFLLTLVGGFVSDSFVSRFWTIIFFGSIETLGLIMLTVQAQIPRMKPEVGSSEHPNAGQAGMLYTGLYMVALGAGGVKSSLPAHGADQFDSEGNNPLQKRLLSTFFNFYFFSLCVGGLLAVTIIVWVQDNLGWQWGFFISTAAIFIALLSFALGLTTYSNKIPSGSPLTRIAQVIVAAMRNRKLPLHNSRVTDSTFPDYVASQQTDQFRFLDKATLGWEITSTRSRWRVCTVKQVEETKLVLKLLPIFASTIMMNCCLAQLQTFSVQQGSTMNRALHRLEIPAASLTAIPLVFMVVLVPLYERAFVPLARRITGQESGITQLQRVGIGLLLSAVAMGVAAAVEMKRKRVATDHALLDTAQPLPISVMWLGWQFLVLGIADMFTLAGLLQFFYSQAPPGMKSLSTSLSWCSTSFGYFLSSVLVMGVNRISQEFGSGVGWLSGNNLNRQRLDLFYWLLCILTSVNFFHYLFWAKWYKYKP
ncbi:protein NRT1/ PTR FAMILY 4.5 [Cryptomeria japonica]|uniref:protein NRT1/ PTR FAMILY 4.5 n=1 Tax=Cryptomeria japonica TaxID=3369 RepID=UPI0025AC4A36|nr:protein NRT1/ PTR FAMILY 4.5 [Cryptomeria japonica]